MKATHKGFSALLETELNLLGAGAVSTPASLSVLAYPVLQQPTVKAHGISVKGLIEEFLEGQVKQKNFCDPKTLNDKIAAYRFLTRLLVRTSL